VNRAALARVVDNPDLAWAILSKSGATYAVVHEDIYLNGNGLRVSQWLRDHGAREVAAAGTDRVFELPPTIIRGD
jgi:hypothetical protein